MNANCFGTAVREWHILSPPFPRCKYISNDSRVVNIITMASKAGNTTHLGLFYVDVLSINKLTDICILWFYPFLNSFLVKEKRHVCK